MLLAEEFLLLALVPGAGRPPLGKGDTLKPALCGALLAELALCQKVVVAGDRVQLADTRPTGDELLDEVLYFLAASGHRPNKVKGEVRALARSLRNVRERVARRLVSAGVLVEERSRIAGIVPLTRYRVRDEEMHQRLQDDLRRWIADPTSSVEERPATLVALLEACHLLGTISEDRAERQRASARARSVMGEVPSARAVRAIIEDVRTAAAAAAVLPG